jgi:hypothetical protein
MLEDWFKFGARLLRRHARLQSPHHQQPPISPLIQVRIVPADQRLHHQRDGQIRRIPAPHYACEFPRRDSDDREGRVI